MNFGINTVEETRDERFYNWNFKPIVFLQDRECDFDSIMIGRRGATNDTDTDTGSATITRPSGTDTRSATLTRPSGTGASINDSGSISASSPGSGARLASENDSSIKGDGFASEVSSKPMDRLHRPPMKMVRHYQPTTGNGVALVDEKEVSLFDEKDGGVVSALENGGDLRGTVGQVTKSASQCDIVYWRTSQNRTNIRFNYVDTDSKTEPSHYFSLDNSVYDLNLVDLSPSEGNDLVGWSHTTEEVVFFLNVDDVQATYSERTLNASGILHGASSRPEETGVFVADFDADGLRDLIVFADDFTWMRNTMDFKDYQTQPSVFECVFVFVFATSNIYLLFESVLLCFLSCTSIWLFKRGHVDGRILCGCRL